MSTFVHIVKMEKPRRLLSSAGLSFIEVQLCSLIVADTSAFLNHLLGSAGPWKTPPPNEVT